MTIYIIRDFNIYLGGIVERKLKCLLLPCSIAISWIPSGLCSFDSHSYVSKSAYACMQDGNSGEDFNKDSIERDERRLTELGRRTVEIFVLAHIFKYYI